MNNHEFIAGYRLGFIFLVSRGFSEAEAHNLASLRMSFMMYPEAFM